MGAERRTDWPAWWDWELELSSHLLKRMVDRRFSEVDLRSMMASGMDLREDDEAGRWVVGTTHESRPWDVIVQPDEDAQLLIIITAYPLESP